MPDKLPPPPPPPPPPDPRDPYESGSRSDPLDESSREDRRAGPDDVRTR